MPKEKELSTNLSKMALDKLILDALQDYERALSNAVANNYKSRRTTSWKVDELRNYLHENITKCSTNGKFFCELKKVTGPTLYWVEVESGLVQNVKSW